MAISDTIIVGNNNRLTPSTRPSLDRQNLANDKPAQQEVDSAIVAKLAATRAPTDRVDLEATAPTPVDQSSGRTLPLDAREPLMHANTNDITSKLASDKLTSDKIANTTLADKIANSRAPISASWKTVFSRTDVTDGAGVNQLMNDIEVFKVTQDDADTNREVAQADALVQQAKKDAALQQAKKDAAEQARKRGGLTPPTIVDVPPDATPPPLTSSTGGLTGTGPTAPVDTAPGLPDGELTVNDDGSITTPGGYTIFDDGNHQWRVEEPDGHQHCIFGDPHVDDDDQNADLTTTPTKADWSFDTNASFILPDGTKIFCDTASVGKSADGADITESIDLKIQYNDSLGTMDVANGGPGTVTTGGLAYDKTHADGALFVLADNHHFVDGDTLGRLYNTADDCVVHADANDKSTITDFARITLNNAIAERDHTKPAVTGLPGGGLTVNPDGSIATPGGDRNVTPRTALDTKVSAPTADTSPTLADMVANVYANVNATDTDTGDTRAKSPASAIVDKGNAVNKGNLRMMVSSLMPSNFGDDVHGRIGSVRGG